VAEKRLTQKDIKQPDQFIVFSVQLIEWVKRHISFFLYGIAGVVVVLGLIIVWGVWQSQRRHTAERLFYETIQLFKDGEKTTDPEQLQEKLQHIMHDYGGTSAAALAAWHLGHLQYARGDYTAALSAYKQAQQWLRGGHEAFLSRLIVLNIGYAQEANGNCNSAISSYETVIQSNAAWLYGEAFLGMGRCYENTGATEKALTTYDQALSKVAVSGAARQQIEARQSALRASLGSPVPRSGANQPNAPEKK
jgi:predicted negative regulator of RcsB-dependent stress response